MNQAAIAARDGAARRPVTDMRGDEAREFFLQHTSYFSDDLPSYLNFTGLLSLVDSSLAGLSFAGILADTKPYSLPDVNYTLLANKDGRLSWRPYELMHPVLYVLLVRLVCEEQNWERVKRCLLRSEASAVECCSYPSQALDGKQERASRILGWWQSMEQRSLALSLEYACVLQTDVVNCYGSLYTHSITWAVDGKEEAKRNAGQKLPWSKRLLGDKVDELIRAGRYGQTNGISQGSALMDLLAEVVLRYVDERITRAIGRRKRLSSVGWKILRYRDDYRIFANTEVVAESLLRIISDELRDIGMRLGSGKTAVFRNAIEGSVKPDKLASLDLLDALAGTSQSLQKQLLRVHQFGARYPNSGGLRRLCGELHERVAKADLELENIEACTAIAVDIAAFSPSAFPSIAGILTYLFQAIPRDAQEQLWLKVRARLKRVANNGYLDVWLQRVFLPLGLEAKFSTRERICLLVKDPAVDLWSLEWIRTKRVKQSLRSGQLPSSDPLGLSMVLPPSEVLSFKRIKQEYQP